MYSRLPVYEEDTDNVIGIVTLKDFFLTKKTDFSIRQIMREAYYTYETKKTDDLLAEMRESSNSIAIVLDEYGACAGLITLEDLLEEIVGEIRDEYDEEEKELIKELAPHVYRIEGSVKLDDINDALDTALDSEDYDSIAGLMIEQLDRLPHAGDLVTLEDGTLLKADRIAKNRIVSVTITLPDPDSETDADSSADEHEPEEADTESRAEAASETLSEAGMLSEADTRTAAGIEAAAKTGIAAVNDGETTAGTEAATSTGTKAAVKTKTVNQTLSISKESD
jgi:Mg2+/Co2+ transporter CorC